MSERNIHEELMSEFKANLPVVEGYEFMSKDPIGNLIYTDVESDGTPIGRSYTILIGGDINKSKVITFQKGNPADDVNGVTLETLIDIAFARTVKANEEVPHWHNNLVIDGLSLASNTLEKRNADRLEACVIGTDKALPRKGTDEFHPVVRRLLTNQDKFNFILRMMIALSESYQDIIDDEAQAEFVEIKPNSVKRLIETTPAEDEAVTVGVASSQKLLAVLEESPLFQIILSTIVHGKKLMGEQPQTNTTQTAVPSEVSNDSTAEQI